MMNISGWFILDGRLRSGWRVSLYLICYLLALLAVQIPAGVLYAVYLVALQGVGDTAELLAAVQPENLPLWFSLALKSLELIILLPLTFGFCRLLDRRDFAGLGFRRNRGWIPDIFLGLALGGAQMFFIFGIEWAGGWLAVSLPDGAALVRGLGASLMAIALFILVAVSEELIFRGYLLVNLREGMGSALALAFSSMLFGLFHALNPNFNLLALLNIALAGLVFGYAWLVTGNLWLPIAYHFSWNFFQGPVFSLPVSGVHYGGLLEVSDRGTASLVTGAAFGPEGGVIGTLVLLSAFPILWAWGRWQQREKDGQ